MRWTWDAASAAGNAADQTSPANLPQWRTCSINTHQQFIDHQFINQSGISNRWCLICSFVHRTPRATPILRTALQGWDGQIDMLQLGFRPSPLNEFKQQRFILRLKSSSFTGDLSGPVTMDSDRKPAQANKQAAPESIRQRSRYSLIRWHRMSLGEAGVLISKPSFIPHSVFNPNA